jgi:hypothetical protein
MTRPTPTLLALLLLAALAPASAEAGGKKFFLSRNTVWGDQALDACGQGYHMASLWEIFDPTLLKYDTKRGGTLGDAGSGPPAGLQGWIRTGANPNPAPTPGLGNWRASASRARRRRAWGARLNARDALREPDAERLFASHGPNWGGADLTSPPLTSVGLSLVTSPVLRSTR